MLRVVDLLETCINTTLEPPDTGELNAYGEAIGYLEVIRRFKPESQAAALARVSQPDPGQPDPKPLSEQRELLNTLKRLAIEMVDDARDRSGT